MAGLASLLGGGVGSMAGPVGSAVGAGLAGAAAGALAGIPKIIASDAEKANKKALEELQKKQGLGMLGLTEAEKQSLYNPAASQIAGRLREGGQIARQAGAAGMQTGAGSDLLRQTMAFEQGAAEAANVAMNVEAQNLARKREMEGDLSAREAQANQYKQDRLNSIVGILTGGLAAGTEAAQQSTTERGAPIASAGPEVKAISSKLGIKDEESAKFLEWLGKNPDAAPYATLLGGK